MPGTAQMTRRRSQSPTPASGQLSFHTWRSARSAAMLSPTAFSSRSPCREAASSCASVYKLLLSAVAAALQGWEGGARVCVLGRSLGRVRGGANRTEGAPANAEREMYGWARTCGKCMQTGLVREQRQRRQRRGSAGLCLRSAGCKTHSLIVLGNSAQCHCRRRGSPRARGQPGGPDKANYQAGLGYYTPRQRLCLWSYVLQLPRDGGCTLDSPHAPTAEDFWRAAPLRGA